MSELFLRLLFGGLTGCAAIVSMIAGLVLYRKVWLTGNTFASLGSEGNVVIFMGVLVAACLLLAWRVKAMQKRL